MSQKERAIYWQLFEKKWICVIYEVMMNMKLAKVLPQKIFHIHFIGCLKSFFIKWNTKNKNIGLGCCNELCKITKYITHETTFVLKNSNLSVMINI